MRAGERYDYCKKALREKAGLTAREARAYLMPNWEDSRVVAEEWKISMDQLMDILGKARGKVEASGLSQEELFCGHQLEVIFIYPVKGDF